MVVNRTAGKIDEYTTLLDFGLMGLEGGGAMYIIQDQGETCLIDGGTATEGLRIVRQLKKLNIFPPNKIILTHSHWDHTQAVPTIMRKAKGTEITPEILASKRAIPRLSDQSFNDVFGLGPYKDLTIPVQSLSENDHVQVGSLDLRILEVPGHIDDHIAILDEKNGNLFVGDAIGNPISDNVFIPAFMPPYFNLKAFEGTIEKIKGISCENLCVAHFGVFSGPAKSEILDTALSTLTSWWQFYEENLDLLGTPELLVKKLKAEKFSKPLTPKEQLMLEAMGLWSCAGFKMARENVDKR